MILPSIFRAKHLEPPPWLYGWLAHGSWFPMIYGRVNADLAVSLPTPAPKQQGPRTPRVAPLPQGHWHHRPASIPPGAGSLHLLLQPNRGAFYAATS
jgi:hypothetical protein